MLRMSRLRPSRYAQHERLRSALSNVMWFDLYTHACCMSGTKALFSVAELGQQIEHGGFHGAASVSSVMSQFFYAEQRASVSFVGLEARRKPKKEGLRTISYSLEKKAWSTPQGAFPHSEILQALSPIFRTTPYIEMCGQEKYHC